ncbi:BCCT family transporter [Flavobacterium agricola]|uniref:BCCT family transporter n=1 Tax=Flavobacterium agricola TaxID=2870839 RepID=UPI002223B0C8|nr:BCCT family transporter [Flavobacterium agricola]
MPKLPRIRTTFSKWVIIPSLIFIIGVCLLAAIFPNVTENLLNVIKNFIFINLNWVYVWAVTIFIFFLFYLVFSKYGDIKLGKNNSKPDYSYFTWISMLFAAGMGIGLMYFSVAEPMQHFSNEVFSGNDVIQRAKDAQMYTFFHWGIHAWAIYAVVGLALAYFTYRYSLPLSLRSCFYPILKDKIKGKWGNAIDVFALCSTFFGITTTLGFGVVQISSGLYTLGIISENSIISQVIIVSILVTLSILSAVSGGR